MAQTNPLSKREREVLQLLLQGKSNKMIALALEISDRTVEFHLKNIYAKFQVSSRIELILRLGTATGRAEFEKLGYSTVDSPGERVENRDRHMVRMDWATSFRNIISMTGQELAMKNLLSTRHVPVGVASALFAGFVWVAMFRYFVHMSLDEIQAWIVPLVVIWAMIGLSVAWIGKRNGHTPLKVCFSTLFGTGLSPIAILPLMGFVVLPVGKFAERLGLIDPSTMTREAATLLATIVMMTLWLVVGFALGILLLFVSIHRPNQVELQRHVSEHGL